MRGLDTDIGGAQRGFPDTRVSAVRATGSDDPRARRAALESLVVGYWKPVYLYLRARWGLANEEAKDLTQSFFARSLEKGAFATYDPSVARFRTFLRACVDHFVANERVAERRVKRGGGQRVVSLDAERAGNGCVRDELASGADVDEIFRREWVRTLLERAATRVRERLAATGRRVHFELFAAYDLADEMTRREATYDSLAARFALKTTQVTNYLHVARREFRAAVLVELRAACDSDAEYQSEARALLGTGAE